MNWPKALKGGLLGGINMTVFVLILRVFNATPLNLEMLLGSLVTERVEVAPWFLGLALHLVLLSLVGVLYGAIMERAGRRGTLMGLGIGVAHAVFSGALLLVLVWIHPLIRSGKLPDPGFLAVHLGLFSVVVFVAVHLLYGIIVGEVYQLQSPEEPGEFRPRVPRMLEG